MLNNTGWDELLVYNLRVLVFFLILGESIVDLVKAIGGKMTEDAFDLVLRYLGLDVSIVKYKYTLKNTEIS